MLSEVLDQLEAANLIEVLPDPEDKRRKVIYTVEIDSTLLTSMKKDQEDQEEAKDNDDKGATAAGMKMEY